MPYGKYGHFKISLLEKTLKNFNWNIVDLQCGISFRCTAK